MVAVAQETALPSSKRNYGDGWAHTHSHSHTPTYKGRLQKDSQLLLSQWSWSTTPQLGILCKSMFFCVVEPRTSLSGLQSTVTALPYADYKTEVLDSLPVPKYKWAVAKTTNY